MIRAIRALIALFAICVVASCGGGDSSKSSKLKTYSGPPVTQVVVKKGDNKGQTVPHTNVVREIVKLGPWRGKPTAYRVPASKEEGLATVVLVQGAKGGRVIGVGKRPEAASSR
mgnify:CR=1 FL=1